MGEIWLIVMVAMAALTFTGFIVLLANRYKRCPSNSIMVI